MNNNNHETSGTPWEGWDDQEVWENINEALDKKEKRRLLPWFLFIGIGLTVLFGIFTPFSKSKGKLIEAKNSSDYANNKVNDIKNTEDIEYCPSTIFQGHQTLKNKIALTSISPNQSIRQSVDDNKIKFPTANDQTFVSTQQDILQNINVQTSTNQEILVSMAHIQNTTPHKLISNNAKLDNLSEGLRVKPYASLELQNTEKDKSGFSLYFDHGIGIGQRIDKFDINILWQKLKHQNETYLYSTMHSLYGVKTFRNGFNIGAGFSYVRHISNLKGSSQHISIVRFESDSARVQQVDGFNYYHNGQLTKTITKNEVFDVYNTYATLSIPIQIGYSFPVGKSTIRIAAGTQFALAQFVKGYTYEAENQITSLDQLTQLNIIKSYGFHELTASASYIYPLTKMLGINMGMDIIMPISNGIKYTDRQSNSYQSKYTSYFAKLGLVYRIK